MKKLEEKGEKGATKMFPATDKQAEIIENYKNGWNQVVSAVPGAGKTSLALLLAMVPNISVLLITFSKRLRDETKARSDALELPDMDVRTFHSVGCHYYSPNTRSDLDLMEIYSSEEEPCRALPTQLDCVILDESQDMCREQFLFCYKFFTDIYCEKQRIFYGHRECENEDGDKDAAGPEPEPEPGDSDSDNRTETSELKQRVSARTRLIVMGDVNQCIFPYKGADPRYLSMAEELWKHHCLFRDMTPGFASSAPPAFRHVSMNGTNRLTGPMVQFLNFNGMCVNPAAPLISLKSERAAAANGGKMAIEKKVQYWRMKKTDMISRIIMKIQQILRSGEGKTGDIFIICPSIHKNYIAKEILNELTHLGHPCFYPNQDDSDKTDEQVLLNKICFLTGHSSKGRERRFCFLLGFDSSYYQFMDRDANPNECTNLLYVGCTRATEELILCEFYTSNTDAYYANRPQEHRFPLPFLKMTSEGMLTGEYSEFMSYFGEGKMSDETDGLERILEQREERGVIKLNATDMVNFLPTAVLEQLNRVMQKWWVVVEPASRVITIPSVVTCGEKDGTGGGGAMGLQEDVSDLNGLAIPSIFMSKYFRDTPGYLYERLVDKLESLEEKRKNGKHMKLLWKNIRQLPRDIWQWSDYLRYFAMEQAFSNNVFHRLRQITEYDWLEADTVQSLIEIFEEVLGEEMSDSRRKGIRPFLEYDLFSSFITRKKGEDTNLPRNSEVDLEMGEVEVEVEVEVEGAMRNLSITPIIKTPITPITNKLPDSEPVMVAGSLESNRSLCSYMGSIISSSSEEWTEKDVEVEIPIGDAESNGMSKSDFFQNALIEALKRRVEESEEYLAMEEEKRGKRRWYEGRGFVFSGALDVVTYRSIWEMKCTSMLSKEHQLQLLLYAWFWKGLEEFYQKSPDSFSDRERKYVAPLRGETVVGKEYHLFNVKTREHLRLKDTLTFAELTDFVALWVDGKNNSVALSVHLSDAEFLRILVDV